MSAKRKTGTQGGRGSSRRPGGHSENTHSAPENLQDTSPQAQPPRNEQRFALDPAEWCFSMIPLDDLPLAEEYEYFRSRPDLLTQASAIVRDIDHPDWGIVSNYFDARRIQVWGRLFFTVDVIKTPWMRLDENTIGIIRQGRPKPPVSQIHIGQAFHEMLRDQPFGEFADDWPKENLSGLFRSISNPYTRGTLRYVRLNTEMLVFKVDWLLATKDEIADEVSRLIRQIPPPPTVLMKPHKPGDPKIGLDYLAMTRICGGLLRLTPKEAPAWIEEQARRDRTIRFGKYSPEIWRNRAGKVQNRFNSLFPGIQKLLRIPASPEE